MVSPKTLPCLHSYCRGCIGSLDVDRHFIASGPLGTRCYQCKAEFKVSEVTDACPFIDSLSNALAPLTGSKCDICCDENAQSYCDFRHLTNAPIHAENTRAITNTIVGKKLAERISLCKKHPKFEVDTYCDTCRESVCPKCVTEKHSGHVFFPSLRRRPP